MAQYSPFDALVLALTGSTGLYWGLEDPSGTTSAKDLSGNSHPLTCTSFTFGAAALLPNEPANTCAALTASSNGTNTYHPSGFTAMSVGAVVDFAAVPTGLEQIFNDLSGSTGVSLRVAATGKPAVDLGNGSTTTTVTASTALTANHAYLLIATWNGTTVTLYTYDITAASAQTAQTGSLSGGTYSSANTINVGGSALVGNIGRVFLLPVALSSAQVTALNAATQVSVSQGAPFFSQLAGV